MTRDFWKKGALGVLLLLFCTAPVPGDIGGCGQSRQELDAETFFATKQDIDCDRCRECGLGTPSCEDACGEELVTRAFPEDCLPLVHDGEVCLRALLAADCDDYVTFMREESPQVPTECDFCPLGGP